MINTIQVQGKVLTPEAVGAPGGSIFIRLPGMAKIDDSGDVHVVAPLQLTSIAIDGSVNFEIIPNDLLSPANTAYFVEYVLSCGAHYHEVWQVSSSGDDPIDIGDIPRVGGLITPIGTLALGGLSDVLISSPVTGQVLGYDSGIWKNVAGGGGSSTLAALTDTNLSGLTNLDNLVYDSATGKWINDQPRMPIYTSASRPAASSSHDGKYIRVRDTNGPTEIQVCVQYSDGSWHWWPVSSTP